MMSTVSNMLDNIWSLLQEGACKMKLTCSFSLRLCASALKATAIFCLFAAGAAAAPNPPTAQDPLISITPATRRMAQTGGTAGINTSGSGTWRASVSDNWILLTSSSGTPPYPVSYTVSANNGVEARIGYVYVSGHVHTITQAGLGATLETYSAEFERAGGNGSVTVNAPSGKTWHAASNVDWITVTTSSGTGPGACFFMVAAFNEVSTRSGTLTIADNTFTVQQTGRRIQLKTTSATTDYFADTLNIRVNALADTEWTVSVNRDWLTVTDAGNGRGGDLVKVAVAENQNYNARNGTVTIGTETFSVTQLGRTALVFRISPTDVATFGMDGTSGERIGVTATPGLGWSAASSADWIELYVGYASGSGNGNVMYKVKPNPTLQPRSGSITFTAADGAVAAKRLDISQEAAVASLTVDSYEFEAAGESLTVGVNTGSIVGWNVIESLDWLSVSVASMTGPANVTLTATANTTVQPRSGTIRIAGHEFRVSQKGRGVAISYDETRVFDADGKTTGENTENSISVTADADVEWTAVASDPTWIVIYQGASGKGNGTVKYIVSPYVGSGEIRTGMITIGDQIAYVTQRPYELSIEPNGTWVDGNAGAGEIQVALDIDGVWNAIATEPWITLVSGYNAGTGSGKVVFRYVDNNTGKERTGKIVIAGEIYTLTQQARQNFAISATVDGHGGHVEGGGVYGLGSAVTLTAVPEAGYAFSHWTLPGNGESTENPLSLTAAAAQSYGAVFTPLAPSLTVASASLKGVELAWTNLAWATEYRVWRGTTSDRGQATKIATLANDGTCRHLDATGVENQTYWYWIEAVGVEDDVWGNAVQGKREKKTFAITYTNLRGTRHSNPATYREGTAVSFTAPSGRVGYTFAGWTPDGIASSTSGDVTARAAWIQNEYTVRFNLNGATGSMEDERYTYGLWKYLTPTNFARAGYKFAGWAVVSTATSPSYGDGESVKNLTTTQNGIVTLYAVWKAPLGIEGDPDALVTGDGDMGYVIRPSDGITEVVVVMDSGIDPSKVTVEVDPEVEALFANGARIRIMSGTHDITGYLNLPSMDASGWMNPSQASVKQEIADESLDPEHGAFFGMEDGFPLLITSPTKPGLLYVLVEGETLDTMDDGDSTIGDGQPWAPVITVDDGPSGFYRIKVSHKGTTPISYAVKFNPNGGSGTMADQEFQCGAARALTANAFTRKGYTFAGWATRPNGSKVYNDEQPVVNLATTDGATMNLYAKWTPITFTVRFHANGGTGSMDDQVYTYDSAQAIRANAFVREGYIFLGWARGATWAKAYDDQQRISNITATPDDTVTLYAKWTPITYAVKFNANGGSGTMANQDFTYGTAQALTANAFTRKGYTFAGWATSASGTKVYDDTQSVSNLAATDGATVNLYAKWNANTYAVKFNANGGSGTLANQSFTYGTAKALTANAFTRTGYTFAGWATSASGAKVYNDKQSVSNLAATAWAVVNLYAKWTPITYAVKFNANGGTGSMTNESFSYGTAQPLSANAFARTGHTFAGWATSANGAKVYDEGQSVANLATTAGATVNLYAIWTPISYTVKFNANGGTGSMADQRFQYGTSQALTSNAFTRAGYTFAGWAISADSPVVYSDGATVTNLADASDSIVMLYAHWTIRSSVQLWEDGPYWAEMNIGAEEPWENGLCFWWGDTVGYRREGSAWVASDGSSSNFSFDSGNTPTYNKSASTLQNEGWITSAGVLAPGHDAAQVHWGGEWRMPTQSELSALNGNCDWTWTTTNGVKGCVVHGRGEYASACIFLPATGYGNGTSLTSAGSYGYLWSSVPYSSTDSSWSIATSSGYHGVGRCNRFLGLSVRPVRLRDGQSANQGFSYTVKFNANGGTGTMANQTFTYGTAQALSANAFTREGHTFVGWAKGANREKAYNDTQCVSNLTATANAMVNLYAKWTPITYTVKFNANGGTGTMANQTFTYGTAQSLSANAFSRTGHTFAGWAASANGAKVHDDGESVVNLTATAGAMVNLYAKWMPIAYAVAFNANGGTGTMANQGFSYGMAQALTANAFTRAGYTFAGWATSENSPVAYADGAAVFNLAETSGTIVILYAQWEKQCGSVQLWEDGPYWAEMNIGAEEPWENGLCFWWGDTVGYRREGSAWVASDGSSSNFSFDSGNTPTYNKSASTLQNEGWITSAGVLAPGHDAAQVHWGGEWRMPTQSELSALNGNCDWTWTTTNGVKGCVVHGRGEYASACIFLPATGYGNGTSLTSAGSYGYLWSSVPYSSTDSSWSIATSSGYHGVGRCNRFLGLSVRPVRLRDGQSANQGFSYTVKFNANGGTGTMANQTFTYGTAQALSANAFTREGYTFAGWATSATGVTVYEDEQSVSNLASNEGAAVNLYAVWEVNQTTSVSQGLSVRYYDISSSGYSTWTQSEAAMTNYFVGRTPTIVTNTLDWGETLQSGFQGNVSDYFTDYPGLWLDNVPTNRYHGKYANRSQEHFTMLFEGELITSQAGTYGFATSCDNAIVLYIDGMKILSFQWPLVNGQPRSATSSLSLSPGKHRITMATYEDTGDQGIFVSWKRPGDTAWSPLPQSVLSHEDGQGSP